MIFLIRYDYMGIIEKKEINSIFHFTKIKEVSEKTVE